MGTKLQSSADSAPKWDDRSLQLGPGKWKPTEKPYRVSTHIKLGQRYDQYRTQCVVFATEAEARAYMATIPAGRKGTWAPKLDVAGNAATWTTNGYWSPLSSDSSLNQGGK